MLSEDEAYSRLRSVFPERDITKPIDYGDLYVFQAFGSDPEEGLFDPFYSVNKTTGEVRDFSVITDGNLNDITEKFMKLRSEDG